MVVRQSYQHLAVSGLFNMKGLYIFGCPLAKYTGNVACKVGITGSWWARFSGYQNSYSKLSHTACFDMVYVGPARAIALLEKTIKERYNWAIDSDKGGESEWLSGHSVSDIEKIVDDLIDGFKFKITKVDAKWLPLSKDTLEEFLKEHQKD
jgi:hypothetical protein